MMSSFYRMGLKRHLTTAEIVEQAVFARRLLSNEVGSISNVVFMVSAHLEVTFQSTGAFQVEQYFVPGPVTIDPINMLNVVS